MAKKDFSKAINAKSAPATSFLTTSPAKSTALEPKQIESTERLTRRVQLLMRPSTYELLRKTAYERGTSVNALINEAVEREYRK